MVSTFGTIRPFFGLHATHISSFVPFYDLSHPFGDTLPRMPKTFAPDPGRLSRAVSAEIRAELARQRVTVVELAARIGRSQNYLSKRLRDESALTIDDVEAICRALSVPYGALLRTALEAIQ